MEKEYLERETLLKNAKKLQGDLFGSVLIVSEIEKMPAANVREVVYGKWIWKDFRYDGSYSLCCSECLETEGARESVKFCPNCGARMYMENEDDE